MRNSFKTTINVNRLEICDLMLACIAAKWASNGSGEKWEKLHDKLKRQLIELDEQLDDIEKDAVEFFKRYGE